jgi:hypothetical protein
MAGWAMKQGSWFKAWQRQYFVLRTAIPEESAAKNLPCTHVLLYYKSQESAASGASPMGAVPIIRGRSTLGEVAKKVRGKFTPGLCIRTSGWHEFEFIILPEENNRKQWLRALGTLEPPPNAAELRKSSIRNGKVSNPIPATHLFHFFGCTSAFLHEVFSSFSSPPNTFFPS